MDHQTSTAATLDAPVSRPKRTGDLLVEKGHITRDQLEAAIRHQRERAPATRLGRIMVELGYCSAEQVVRALASNIGCPFVRVGADMVQPEALCALPLAFLDTHNLLPLRKSEGWLTVALEQFNDPFLLAEVSRRAGLRVQPVAAVPEALRAARQAALGQLKGGAPSARPDGDGSLDLILGGTELTDLQVVEDTREDDANLEASATESPIVKLVNFVIKRALDVNASDIHIEPDDSHFRVRYRVDGELVAGERPVRRLLPAVVSRIKILAGMDISERRLPQDGSLVVSLQNRPIDLRVSTMATRQGEKVVMRIVDRESGTRSAEELGLEGWMLRAIRDLVREPHGLTLVTGPTGSGKSTTLYSLLAEIASDRHNISTVEDPVERRIKGVNQFQVQEDVGFTFARALRSLLRQDPDVLMVGEIRDADTAALATEAALTGHLVLSTLHTNDAPSAIPRLVNLGVKPFLIAATLRGVLAQRLVRRVCQSCRRQVTPAPKQARVLQGLCGQSFALSKSYAGSGCSRCNGRGSIGRVGVFDLLVLREDTLAEAFTGAHGFTAEAVQPRRDIPGLLADGLAKVERGVVGLDSILELVLQASVAEPTGDGAPSASAGDRN